MTRNDRVSDVCLYGCLRSFDEVRSALRIVPAKGTMIRPLADSGLEMVDCYRKDSGNFLADKDHVTAFAAINYAHAWISCFTKLGLFESVPGEELFKRIGTDDSENYSIITAEKMGKYLDITSRARKKLRISPPPRSFERRLAIDFLDTSESYFKRAVEYRNGDDFVRAFAAVNYAHAWLDGGARMGLFDVEEDDVLFTLYE